MRPPLHPTRAVSPPLCHRAVNLPLPRAIIISPLNRGGENDYNRQPREAGHVRTFWRFLYSASDGKRFCDLPAALTWPITTLMAQLDGTGFQLRRGAATTWRSWMERGSSYDVGGPPGWKRLRSEGGPSTGLRAGSRDERGTIMYVS